MVQTGPVKVAFSAKSHGVDVTFDPHSGQHLLSFNFAVSVSLPQLLQQLLEFQQRESWSVGVSGTGGPDPSQPEPQVNLVSGALPAVVAQAPVSMEQPLAAERQELQTSQPEASQVVSPQPDSLGPAPEEALSTLSAADRQLLEGAHEHDFAKVKLALQQGADVQCQEGAPYFRSALHLSVERGGSLELMDALLEAKADIHSVMASGRTPLHVAIQQYANVSPTILRMLLCSNADLNIKDTRGTTPLDLVKMVAVQSCQASGGVALGGAESPKVRQLLNEVTEQPTLAICTLPGMNIDNVLFGDTVNDKLVFYSGAFVGLYSLKQKRTTFINKLRQPGSVISSTVQHVSVNPELGTVAVCLGVIQANQGEVQSVQNVTVIWPNGNLQDEEPLKLSIQINQSSGVLDSELLPAQVILSRSFGPQMLLSRLSDGQVYCWLLNSARSQLVSEVQLKKRGGLIATSDDGCWIAVANQEREPSRHIEIWMYENLGNPQGKPKLVCSLNKRPSSMAVAHKQSFSPTANRPPTRPPGYCLLAFTEEVKPGQPLGPIEIISVAPDGTCNNVYRVRLSSPCLSLSFCHGSSTHLLSGLADGSAIVYNLPQGEVTFSHDNPGTKCFSASTDRTLLASSDANYFRVYKVAE